MSDLEYTYAVARIRTKELSLFSAATIEQLLARKSYENCLQFLQEKGWGDSDTPLEAEKILTREREKTWEDIRELVKDMSVFGILDYPNVFHNLKAAIKEVCTEGHSANIFYKDTNPSAEEILEAVRNRDFGNLPAYMADAAAEAFETLLHTRDGQLCDVIVDRAALDAIYQAGKSAKDEIIRAYAESAVAVADIKIAVRSQKTAKSLEFMKRALAPCGSLNVEALAHAALGGPEAIRDYLAGTDYAEGAEALAVSPSAFERWCDNRIIYTIRPQKYNSFSVGPIVAYALARENEIKTVRIILSGKLNGLSDDSIRERVREMYV
ncbi:MAG: V-type ATPase subunit [Lachnospiraceae bacterium]|uniref:V0D/AC39 family V-type ATPase subunit n=1 Tax=Candidatus Merdisoma sp. JLR.KK011 TaxID=3114299 RepID=UPI0014344639|nr:V-type ATPase subunit [Lachnospiraceae bacterium]GFI10068.1 V-type sodium ATPase subunit C [Lachnospiraceae bacterium]